MRNYLLMINQDSYLALGHILAEINQVNKKQWPEKFVHFETAFENFARQRMENKAKVGGILTTETVNGFLQTLASYKDMVKACLDKEKKSSNRSKLKTSMHLIESLVEEISPQLNEQGFDVS